MSSINIICGKKMTYIQEKLFELQDEKYAAFQSRLTPNVDPKIFIGVRVPECRKLAKKLFGEFVSRAKELSLGKDELISIIKEMEL